MHDIASSVLLRDPKQKTRSDARNGPPGPPSSKPPTPKNRRVASKGVLVGEWRLAFHGGSRVGLTGNAVYGFRDGKGRILFRISIDHGIKYSSQIRLYNQRFADRASNIEHKRFLLQDIEDATGATRTLT